MNIHKVSRISVFFLGIGCSYLLFVGAYSGWVSEAACPGIISFGWRANSNAIYTASTFTPQERNQIDAALSIWNTHNALFSGNNCSDVVFMSGAGPFSITSSPDQPTVAHASAVTKIHVTAGIVDSAITTFYWNSIATAGYPVWNRNNSPQYYQFILEVMLHEAGHTMGLADALAPFTANQTVMNPYNGTNDSNHNMPTDVQPCDDSTIRSIPQYNKYPD